MSPFEPATTMMTATVSVIHLTDGTIVAIDPTQRVLTIAHGEIPGMSMPAMTMPFSLHESPPVGSPKTGQSITFAVGTDGGGMAITGVGPASPQPAARGEHGGHGMPGMPSSPGMPMMAQCHEMMSRR